MLLPLLQLERPLHAVADRSPRALRDGHAREVDEPRRVRAGGHPRRAGVRGRQLDGAEARVGALHLQQRNTAGEWIGERARNHF